MRTWARLWTHKRNGWKWWKAVDSSKVYQVSHIIFERLGGLKIDGQCISGSSDTYLLMDLVNVDEQAAPFTSRLEPTTRHFLARPDKNPA